MAESSQSSDLIRRPDPDTLFSFSYDVSYHVEPGIRMTTYPEHCTCATLSRFFDWNKSSGTVSHFSASCGSTDLSASCGPPDSFPFLLALPGHFIYGDLDA
jgi:hypothetical protein